MLSVVPEIPCSMLRQNYSLSAESMAATKRDTHPIDTMLAISDVLTHPRLAQLYTRVRERDTATVDELAAGRQLVDNDLRRCESTHRHGSTRARDRNHPSRTP